MAQPGRTVRVSGLPSDIEDVRLKDKLLIHFQRFSNGGGEIDSVNIVKETPVSALITFQESRVAQRVIRRSQHLLVIDGRNYNLTVTEHCDCMDPNQVIVSLSATVDYRRLPGGALFLTNLLENHRDVHINYTDTEDCCKLSGTYSKVQAVLTQLLRHTGLSESAKDKLNVENVSSESRGVKTAHKPHARKTEDQNRMFQKQKGEANSVKQAHDNDSPGGSSSNDTRQAALMPEEDCSLIVDALLFKYLQKNYSEECQNILRLYDVCMLDKTNQGLTTLILEPLTAVRGVYGNHSMLAKEAVCRFYQKHQENIRQDRIAKTTLPSKGQLGRAMESLCARYPKVLVSEDECYVDIIGTTSDLSEAKLFLQNFDNTEITSKPEHASLPKHTSPPYIGDHVFKNVWTEEEQKIPKRPKRPKLAAQFNDPFAVGHRSADIAIGTNLSRSGQSRPGPMLGIDVLSKPEKVSNEPISRALPQNIGSDILFKNSTTSPSSMLNPELMDARPKSLTPHRTSQSSLMGNTSLQPVGSKSTLRRSSSFSAIPQEKAVVMEPESLDNSSKALVRSRARSSSFSSETNKEKHEIHKAEITVRVWIWYYMKKVHRVQVDDLTSDVLMKERLSEDHTHVTLTLRGANKDKVSFSQFGLQQLVDLLSSDVLVRELSLSDLGVSDSKDETLQACCSEVQSRFKKVLIKFTENRMIFFGPRNLCSQLCATFRDIFSGSLDQADDQPKSTSQYNSMGNFPSSMEINGDRVREHDSNTQAMFPSRAGKADGSSKIQGWQTTYRSDFCDKDAANGFKSLPTVNKTSAVDSTPSFLRPTASGNNAVEGITDVGLNDRDGDVKQMAGVGEHQEKTDNSSEKK